MKMKTLILLSVLLGLTYFCDSQTIETEYFKDIYLTKKALKDNAKYSKTVINNHDSIVTTEIRKIKTDEIVETYTYKHKIPYGIWKIQTFGSSEKNLDYDFDLCYEKRICEDFIPGSDVYKIFNDNPDIGYVSPKFSGNNHTIIEFLGNQLVYPKDARENGITGTVKVYIDINEKGEVEDVCVSQGTNIFLDKESVRVLKNLKFVSPPYLNGKAVKVCAIIPIKFSMQ
jgi:TonB family protein